MPKLSKEMRYVGAKLSWFYLRFRYSLSWLLIWLHLMPKKYCYINFFGSWYSYSCFCLSFSCNKITCRTVRSNYDNYLTMKVEKPIVFSLSLYFLCICNIKSEDLLPLCMQDRDGQATIIALRPISKGEEVCLCQYLIGQQIGY